MKEILCLILLTISSTLVGQVREELNYYPLHVGDLWQYKITYTSESSKVKTLYMKKEILSDTLIENKKYYCMLEPPMTYQKFNSPFKKYVHLDSLSGLIAYYDLTSHKELNFDSLFVKPNVKYFDHNRLFTTFSEMIVFNLTSKIRLTDNLDIYHSVKWWMSPNIGIIKMIDGLSSVTYEGNEYVLVYAKINGKEYGTYVSVENEETVPTKFSLSQNFPNPFNPETTISYSLPKSEHVTLKIFDVLGREVATLVNEFKLAGAYSTKLNTQNYKMSSGVYFYRLQAGSFSETKKLVVVK